MNEPMSPFWANVTLTPLWVWVVVILGSLVAAVTLVGSWRREACSYLINGWNEAKETWRLIQIIKPVGWSRMLWKKLFRRGRKVPDWCEGVAVGLIGAFCGVLAMVGFNTYLPRIPAPVPSPVRSWTTQADFAAWKLDGAQSTKDGSMELSSFGGDGAWRKVTFPSSTGAKLLSASSSDNVWVSDGQTNVFAFDGKTWKPFIGVVAPGTTIGAILTFGSNDTWAFSDYGVAAHWDGRSWANQFVHRSDGVWMEFTSAWGTDSRHLWAGANGAIAYYDGVKWAEQVGPGSMIARFTKLSGSGPDNIWAVNSSGSGTDSTWRYDGKSWRTATSAAPLTLSSVCSPAPGVAWYADGHISSAYQTSGSNLKSHGLSIQPRDVDGVAANDVWAVGTLKDGYNLSHFDGKEWQPGVAATDDDLIVVRAVSHETVFAISSTALYAFQGKKRYQDHGTAEVTCRAAQPKEWQGCLVAKEVPPGTKLDIEFSANGVLWTSVLGEVGPTTELHIRATFESRSTSLTPRVKMVTVR